MQYKFCHIVNDKYLYTRVLRQHLPFASRDRLISCATNSIVCALLFDSMNHIYGAMFRVVQLYINSMSRCTTKTSQTQFCLITFRESIHSCQYFHQHHDQMYSTLNQLKRIPNFKQKGCIASYSVSYDYSHEFYCFEI